MLNALIVFESMISNVSLFSSQVKSCQSWTNDGQWAGRVWWLTKMQEKKLLSS